MNASAQPHPSNSVALSMRENAVQPIKQLMNNNVALLQNSSADLYLTNLVGQFGNPVVEEEEEDLEEAIGEEREQLEL